MTRFQPGQIVSTPGALDALSAEQLGTLLDRHLSGDWGDLDAEDKRRNDEAITNGARIFSAYHVDDTKLWVITEADRSSTCVLLPSEY